MSSETINPILETAAPVAAPAEPAVSAPEPAPPQPQPAAAAPIPQPSAPFAGTPSYLLDVKLTVSAEVGRVHVPVREVMEYGQGSLIELQRSAAEPVEIFANGRCIGRGEIVVIGEQFGVRVTELGAG